MKQDWRIIRQILLRLEAEPKPNARISANHFENLDFQEVAYNMRLLQDAGCIEAVFRDSSTGDGEINFATAKRLTIAGHELLDTIRNDTIWEKTKDHFRSKGVEMSVDMVMSVGKRLIDHMLSS
jgi:hypothetical protein